MAPSQIAAQKDEVVGSYEDLIESGIGEAYTRLMHNSNARTECNQEISKILRSDLMPLYGRNIGCMCKVSRSKYKMLYANYVVCPLGEVLRL